MKNIFKNQNNNNFYILKEIQWTNKAMKMNQLNERIKNQRSPKNVDSINSFKEKSWNQRFIYDSIQNYDATKDKNVLANLIGVDEMNCYHNAIKKNNLILKSFYSNNKYKRKSTEEFGKTNLRINLKPIGNNLKKSKLMNNSFSTNKFITNKRISLESFDNKNSFNKKLNSDINSNNYPDKLSKLWNDLCILHPYRELFNIILSNLSEERKEDICKREFKELNEIKNDLESLSGSVYYRFKILEELNDLNDKLGFILKNNQTNSKEVILKKISKKIEHLREHTINICFSMQKIKSKINEIQSNKFDLDSLAEKFKFDKNYLIKMKEEMAILREGYTKYFFDIGEENDPFLLSASKQDDKEDKIKDPFFHYIPLSDEMRENIHQCIYIIYQELIGYKSSNILENNSRNISPIKKYNYKEIDITIFQKHNKIFNNKNRKISKNNLWRNGFISPYRTSYSEAYKPSKSISSGNKSENNKIIDNNNINPIKDLKFNYNNKSNNKDIITNKNDMNVYNDINNKNNENNYVNDNNIYSEKYNSNNNTHNFNKNDNIKTNDGKTSSNLNNEENDIEIYNENHNNFSNDMIQLKLNNNINNKDKQESKKEKIKTKNINNEQINNNDNNKNSNYNINNQDVQKKLNKISSTNKILKEEEEEEDESYEGEEENSESFDKNKKDKLNKNMNQIKYKDIKIIIFNDDISTFSKEFYNYYFTSISKEIKNMFKIEKNIIKNMTQGISPYMLLAYDNASILKEVDITNWINFKNYILGICAFSFEHQKSLINININHISNSIPNNGKTFDKQNLEKIMNIFKLFIEFIKKHFYFDEIIIRYNSSKNNEQILNFFLNELNFLIISETENEEIEDDENIHKENKEKEKSEIYYKIVYTNDSSKNRVDDSLIESFQSYIGNNIFDIFDSIVITNSRELISSEKGKKNESYLINNVIMKYLLEKKEKTNVNRIYNKLSNLDQLIKVFNDYFNNSTFFNNYNTNNPSSHFDKRTGYYYNFIKADKVLALENEKYHVKLYHILNNNMSLLFCKVFDDFEKYLTKNNIYNQINILYKEAISLNKIEVLNDKILWIPCFEIYKHLKTLSFNGFGTFHEYIKISNKVIHKLNKELLLIKKKNTKENKEYKMLPDLNNDILFDDDFILGVVNNTDIFNEIIFDEKNKIISNNRKGEPYVIFLSLIKKSDFICKKYK